MSLLGSLEYDTQSKTFKKFDVTAAGNWTWPAHEGKPTHVLGVTLELWTRPFASPLYDRFFPGVSMQHYGYDEKKE